MEHVVTDHYWAVWGHAVRKKSRQSGAKWVKNLPVKWCMVV